MDSRMKTGKYKVILFDLDHTLWDYERNARKTLSDLFDTYLEGLNGIERPAFQDEFIRINDVIWEQYDRGEISRDDIRIVRFVEVLKLYGIDDQPLAHQMSMDYMKQGPYQPHLVPGAKELLDQLVEKYSLYVLTNGFEDVQNLKIRSSGITDYFKEIITSEKAGAKKPAPGVFEYALQRAGCSKEESVMVGDNLLTDIAGSINYGMDAVFYNPKKKEHNAPVKYEISHLLELSDIL